MWFIIFSFIEYGYWTSTKQKKHVLTIVSSIGYVVSSGKIQVDKQDTTFFTPASWDACSTLSLI